MDEYMKDLEKLMETRQSRRLAFDPDRKIPKEALKHILEAARWAPTPHNMQNFEIVAVDDKKTIWRLGNIKSHISEAFLRENYKQFSFSKKEYLRKKVGVLSTTFPEAWRNPKSIRELVSEGASSPMNQSIRGSPMLLFLIYDSRKRAPASAGDALGLIGLGCVTENMWLMAESLGIGFQILSTFGNDPVESHARRILGIPRYMNIIFVLRLGYPLSGQKSKPLRVRRDVKTFTHYNKY